MVAGRVAGGGALTALPVGSDSIAQHRERAGDLAALAVAGSGRLRWLRSSAHAAMHPAAGGQAGQAGRALEAVRRYLPPEDSTGFNIITGERLGTQAPLSSKGRIDPAAAVSSGTFRRQQRLARPQDTVSAKLTAKSRNKEDWVNDLAAAGVSKRHGRRSPMRRRPPSAEPPGNSRPSRGRKVDPELHGYRREPVVTEGAPSRGLRASDLTEPLFFPPRQRSQGSMSVDAPAAAGAAPSSSSARRKGAGSEWPWPAPGETMSALIRSPEAAGTPAAPQVEVEVDKDNAAPMLVAPAETAAETAGIDSEPAEPSAALATEDGHQDTPPAPACSEPNHPVAQAGASPSTSRQTTVTTPSHTRQAETAELQVAPRSPAARPRAQSARRSESMHIERMMKARDLIKAPAAGKAVMENRRPRVSSRRGSSAGQRSGVLLASQWDGQGLAFATGSDADRPSRRVEYVTMTQEAQKVARSKLEERGGERTVWNAPPAAQKPSSASLRRRNSMPGFLTDGSSTETCEEFPPPQH